MATIEIDFDVYKALTNLREDEAVSYNDVLRRLLNLGGSPTEPRSEESGCAIQGVTFPEGTRFQVRYKGVLYTAEIKNGRWVGNDGKVRTSPSDAATAITHTNVNGWRFWSVKRPNDSAWRKMAELKPS